MMEVTFSVNGDARTDLPSVPLSKEYVVAICGYEGIEALLGTYTLFEASEAAIRLKAGMEPGAMAAVYEEAGQEWLGDFGPEQVCLMGPAEKGRHLTCCCHLLPEEYRSHQAWWM